MLHKGWFVCKHCDQDIKFIEEKNKYIHVENEEDFCQYYDNLEFAEPHLMECRHYDKSISCKTCSHNDIHEFTFLCSITCGKSKGICDNLR